MRILRGGGAGKNLESTENLIHLIFALFIVDIFMLMAMGKLENTQFVIMIQGCVF